MVETLIPVAGIGKNSNDLLLTELEKVRQKNRGILKAEDVISAAESENSYLHQFFEWDDAKAGQEYRLEQARGLIQVVVTVLPNQSKPIRAYVSLEEDRQKPGGGYRALVEVMVDPHRRVHLLDQALRELEFWEDKYGDIEELVPVFRAAKLVKHKAA